MACVGLKTGSQAGLARDERAAVYVEFLIVFFPVFLFFLGICQVALVSAARLVVRHSANVSARAAIVVLEDDPDNFNGEARGMLTSSAPQSSTLYQTLFDQLGVSPGSSVEFEPPEGTHPQNGSRMDAIRYAAYLPLALLAPSDPSTPGQDSISDALSQSFVQKLASTFAYDRGASVVTVHTDGASDAPAPEPIARNALVTVRVTYLYPCTIPVVRLIACRTLEQLRGPKGSTNSQPAAAADSATPEQRRVTLRFALAEDPTSLEQLAGDDMRFVVIGAAATLPNQGAGYY